MTEPRMTVRAAVAAFHLHLLQLLEVAGVADNSTDITDLTVNVNLRLHRIDVARLAPDGQHLGEWLCGFSIDPHDLPTFGTPVSLPGTTGSTH